MMISLYCGATAETDVACIASVSARVRRESWDKRKKKKE